MNEEKKGQIYFSLYCKYRIKEVLTGLGGFRIGGEVIRTVKYTVDLALLAKE
jgi:hypothetical protein